MQALKLKNVFKYYGELCAVNDLSLSVPKGSCYGLLGPNGSGKTTTLRMIMNIIMPDSGEVQLLENGNSIGYLPEERGLYPKMKIYELLHFFAEIRGMDSKTAQTKIEYWLDRMELLDRINNRVDELSKGMQQKLQLVTTIIHEPNFIVLDEPFIGLDPIAIDQLRVMIKELQGAGKTVLLSTHWMDQAERLCDYICLINKGKKVMEGALKLIKRGFRKNGFILELEGEANFLKQIDYVDKIEYDGDQLRVELKEDGDPKEFIKIAFEQGNLKGFKLLEPSLEEIFIEKVKEYE
ncbi:MAG TPA: ATP-binding cassette domain-containing protein [bacterium (Candidatus Stahlbacteria)]|nr:ATP-binding cassette domain-containing protein [Candidatus Stahlbacteria bacterium]